MGVINTINPKIYTICTTDDISYITDCVGVIGNIAFPLGRNIGKIISFTFFGDEFNLSPPVAPRLLTSNDRNVFLRLSQAAPIELMFGGV